MLLIAELGVAVLLLSAGVLAFRQSRRERLSNKRMFRVCVVLGLLVGGALGFTIDWTLTRLGAGPAMPSEECLLTVSTDDGFIEKVKGVLFRHRARHVLRA